MSTRSPSRRTHEGGLESLHGTPTGCNDAVWTVAEIECRFLGSAHGVVMSVVNGGAQAASSRRAPDPISGVKRPVGAFLRCMFVNGGAACTRADCHSRARVDPERADLVVRSSWGLRPSSGLGFDRADHIDPASRRSTLRSCGHLCPGVAAFVR